MLAVKDLVVDIDGSHILRKVSLEVSAGELVCLVGRNGAGKSTTFRTIIGARKAASGTITLEGRDVTGLAPFRSRPGRGPPPEESGCSAISRWPEHPAADVDAGNGRTTRSEALAYRVFPD
jgi:branched-chain amino acid transport system ATP-binding protein